MKNSETIFTIYLGTNLPQPADQSHIEKVLGILNFAGRHNATVFPATGLYDGKIVHSIVIKIVGWSAVDDIAIDLAKIFEQEAIAIEADGALRTLTTPKENVVQLIRV
jgi:hypothetical protein|tara:strand:- start:158 stop:481 length:324 start_codon:yes stop_codon:yes gene_type:complete